MLCIGLPKFVELTNCGSTAVDLSAYAIQTYNNGAPSYDNSVALKGTLASGDSYVISFENSDTPQSSTFYTVYGFDADELSPGATWNGDDAMALVSNGGAVVVDVDDPSATVKSANDAPSLSDTTMSPRAREESPIESQSADMPVWAIVLVSCLGGLMWQH
jgi:Lamin Tail Domain